MEYQGGIGRRRLLSFTEISTVLGLSLSIFSGFVHKWCDLRDYSSDAEEVMEGTKCDLVLHGTNFLPKLEVEEPGLILKKPHGVQAE